MAKKKLTFEEGMQELETLVRSLEMGEMPLEATFKAFERANELRKMLQGILDEGDQRIRVLMESEEKEMEAEE